MSPFGDFSLPLLRALVVIVVACFVAVVAGPVIAAQIDGTPADDTLIGTPDADTINGFAGNDSIYGGDGNDTIDGGPGADSLYGEGGDDVLNARDGEVDIVDCGPGQDTATVDSFDEVVDCETVNGQASGGNNSKPLGRFLITPVPGRRAATLVGFKFSGLPGGATVDAQCDRGCSRALFAHTTTPRRGMRFPAFKVRRRTVLEIDARAPGYGSGRYYCMGFAKNGSRLTPTLRGTAPLSLGDPVHSVHC